MEELVEVSRVFPQDRIQQRFVEQTDETPDISLAEKIVEKPVTQTQGNTQQVVNMLCSAQRPTVAVHRQGRVTSLSWRGGRFA